MKKITLKHLALLLLLAFAGANIANAQSTEPLVSEGKQWNVIFRFAPWTPPQPATCYTTCYKLEGETVIDGCTYQLMLQTYREDLTGWTVNSALREDNGKVFYRNYLGNGTFNPEEALLYDFSMQIGDSINPYPYDDENYVFLVLDAVKDTIIGDDITRKRYEFHYSEGGYPNYSSKEIWVEGIGSEFGIFSSGDLALIGGSNSLLCSYENDEIVWENTGSLHTCFYSNYDITGIEELETKEATIYPNPAGNTLNISFAQDAECQSVEIHSLDGRLIETFPETSLQTGNQTTLDISNLTAGVYIMKVKLVDGKEFTEKLIKNQ